MRLAGSGSLSPCGRSTFKANRHSRSHHWDSFNHFVYFNSNPKPLSWTWGKVGETELQGHICQAEMKMVLISIFSQGRILQLSGNCKIRNYYPEDELEILKHLVHCLIVQWHYDTEKWLMTFTTKKKAQEQFSFIHECFCFMDMKVKKSLTSVEEIIQKRHISTRFREQWYTNIFKLETDSPRPPWLGSSWHHPRRSTECAAGREGSRLGRRTPPPGWPWRRRRWWRSSGWWWPRRRPAGRWRSLRGHCTAALYHTEKKMRQLLRYKIKQIKADRSSSSSCDYQSWFLASSRQRRRVFKGNQSSDKPFFSGLSHNHRVEVITCHSCALPAWERTLLILASNTRLFTDITAAMHNSKTLLKKKISGEYFRAIMVENF